MQYKMEKRLKATEQFANLSRFKLNELKDYLKQNLFLYKKKTIQQYFDLRIQ